LGARAALDERQAGLLYEAAPSLRRRED